MSAPADAATSFISRRRRIIPGPTASVRHCFHSASTLYVTRTGIVIRYDTIRRDAVLTCTQNRTEPKTKKWERRSSSVEAGTPAVCPRCRSSSRPIFDRRRSDPEPIRSGADPIRHRSDPGHRRTTSSDVAARSWHSLNTMEKRATSRNCSTGGFSGSLQRQFHVTSVYFVIEVIFIIFVFSFLSPLNFLPPFLSSLPVSCTFLWKGWH